MSHYVHITLNMQKLQAVTCISRDVDSYEALCLGNYYATLHYAYVHVLLYGREYC